MSFRAIGSTTKIYATAVELQMKEKVRQAVEDDADRQPLMFIEGEHLEARYKNPERNSKTCTETWLIIFLESVQAWARENERVMLFSVVRMLGSPDREWIYAITGKRIHQFKKSQSY